MLWVKSKLVSHFDGFAPDRQVNLQVELYLDNDAKLTVFVDLIVGYDKKIAT